MELEWVIIDRNAEESAGYYRARVPGGWLVEVRAYNGISITFVPDEEHRWVI